MNGKNLILASFFNHPSFINQSLLIEKIYKLNGYRVMFSTEYFSKKERHPEYDVLIYLVLQ